MWSLSVIWHNTHTHANTQKHIHTHKHTHTYTGTHTHTHTHFKERYAQCNFKNEYDNSPLRRVSVDCRRNYWHAFNCYCDGNAVIVMHVKLVVLVVVLRSDTGGSCSSSGGGVFSATGTDRSTSVSQQRFGCRVTPVSFPRLYLLPWCNTFAMRTCFWSHRCVIQMPDKCWCDKFYSLQATTTVLIVWTSDMPSYYPRCEQLDSIWPCPACSALSYDVVQCRAVLYSAMLCHYGVMRCGAV